MSYNVHGLENKYLHQDFFDFVKQHDIFILLETHIEEININRFDNSFKMFKTLWKPATRINRFGRAIGGYVCGVKKV